MKTLKHFLVRYPLISSVLLNLVFIGIPYWIMYFFFGLKSNPIQFTLYNLVPTIGVVWLVVAMRWGKETGLTLPISNWNPRWWIWTLAFVIFELRLLILLQWDALTLSPLGLTVWLLSMVLIGLKEELLDRGLIFYLLYRSWGHTRLGVLGAFLGQAAIFGLGHYMNAFSGHDISAVHAQVITTIGYGMAFGGLYVITRSIWPCVLVHTLHNAILLMNSTFGTAKQGTPRAIDNNMLPALVLFAILCSVYGIVCLLRSQLYAQVANKTSGDHGGGPKDSNLVDSNISGSVAESLEPKALSTDGG